MTRGHIRITAFALVLAGALGAGAGPAGAQGAPAGDRLQALIQELKAQFDRGERDRLVDPWFLRDLRQTLRAYEWPWSKRLLSDDFSGRGPQPDPPWRVTAGDFLIDWRFGLRSVVEHRAAQAQAQPQAPAEKSGAQNEAVKQLFGQILQKAITGEGDKAKTQAPPASPEAAAAPGYAAVVAALAISNGFALRVEMTARGTEGAGPKRFEFGPYQGPNAVAGYRLAYNPGAAAGTPSLELVRLSARGTSATVEVHDKPLALEDGQPHVFEWTRDAAGVMVVRLDGAPVITVTDRGFSDPFDGFAVLNSGGDYALRSVTIDGTP